MGETINPLNDLTNLVDEKTTSTLDLVSSLMSEENVDLKTEIINPYPLTTLITIANYLDEHGLKSASNIIKKWINKLNIYMISNARKGRQEIVQILHSYYAEEQRKKDISLTSNLAKMNNREGF